MVRLRVPVRLATLHVMRIASLIPIRLRSQEDGGDIEYVKFENGVVYLRMQVPPRFLSDVAY